MHDAGNEENVFDRMDYRFSDANSAQLNLGYTRSWFQIPNSYDAQYAVAWSVAGCAGTDGRPGARRSISWPADQVAKIGTFNIAPTFVHLIGGDALLTIGAFVRQDQFKYYPSANPFADLTPDLQSDSIAQSRRLTNAGLRTDISYAKGCTTSKPESPTSTPS